MQQKKQKTKKEQKSRKFKKNKSETKKDLAEQRRRAKYCLNAKREPPFSILLRTSPIAQNENFVQLGEGESTAKSISAAYAPYKDPPYTDHAISIFEYVFNARITSALVHDPCNRIFYAQLLQSNFQVYFLEPLYKAPSHTMRSF
jgi:hypothetical protein